MKFISVYKICIFIFSFFLVSCVPDEEKIKKGLLKKFNLSEKFTLDPEEKTIENFISPSLKGAREKCDFEHFKIESNKIKSGIQPDCLRDPGGMDFFICLCRLTLYEKNNPSRQYQFYLKTTSN